VNFSDVRIAIVGTTDVIGTKRLVPNEAGVFVSRMSGGNQHRATREVTEGDGVGLAIDLGTLRPPVSHAILARMGMIEHLASTRENGRRNRSALTVTGTQEQKKVVSLRMRSTTLCRSMRTSLRLKMRKSPRNRL
jgi:hypothetical protein